MMPTPDGPGLTPAEWARHMADPRLAALEAERDRLRKLVAEYEGRLRLTDPEFLAVTRAMIGVPTATDNR